MNACAVPLVQSRFEDEPPSRLPCAWHCSVAAVQVLPELGGFSVRLASNDILAKPLVLAVAGPVSRFRTKHREIAEPIHAELLIQN